MEQRGEEARKRGGGKGQSARQHGMNHAPATGRALSRSQSTASPCPLTAAQIMGSVSSS